MARAPVAMWALVWTLSASLLLGLIGLQREATAVVLSKERTPQEESALWIELDLPDHLPAELRHPQKFFAGRKIRIVGGFPSVTTAQAVGLGRRTGIRKELVFLNAKHESLVFTIPPETPTDRYDVRLNVDGATYLVPLSITGLQTDASAPSVALWETAPSSPAILYRSALNCGNCFWELTLVGHPTDSNQLLLAGSWSRMAHASLDGGRTWSARTFEPPSSATRPSPATGLCGRITAMGTGTSISTI